jgi:hypothetical protein
MHLIMPATGETGTALLDESRQLSPARALDGPRKGIQGVCGISLIRMETQPSLLPLVKALDTCLGANPFFPGDGHE